jgi:hypothetical protein
MNRWHEYEAGTLTPPVIVQHDEVNGEHLVWVWTGKAIRGPVSRREWNAEIEAAVLAIDFDPAPDTFEITSEDGTVITGELV